MIFGEGGSAAGRAAYRCRAAACAAAIAAGALLFPQPGQAAATTPHDTATAPQSAVTAQQQVAASQSAVAAPQQVAAQPAVDAGTSPDGGVAAAAGEGAGPAGKAPAVPMPGVSAPEPSARAETINAVLTASWETASIPDHQASNLKLHINRASAAMAVSGLAFTVTLPSGLTVADDVPTMGCTATPALTNGTATIAFSAVGLGIGVTDCDLVVAVAGISSGTYPLANGDVSGTSGVSANVAAQLQITPALPRIHGYFSPATIDPGDPSQLRLNLMRTDNNMTAGPAGWASGSRCRSGSPSSGSAAPTPAAARSARSPARASSRSAVPRCRPARRTAR